MPKSDLNNDEWFSVNTPPSKKGTYRLRLHAIGANPPYVEIEADWNGKKWLEDGEFSIDNDSIAGWKSND